MARNKTPEEKFHILNQLSDCLRAGMTRNKALNHIRENGVKISSKTLYEYAEELKEQWKESRMESYDQHIADQLARLDFIIENLWRMFYASQGSKVKDVIEYGISKASDDSPELLTEIHAVGRASDPSDENPKVSKGEVQDLRKKTAKQTIIQSEGNLEIIREIKELWKERNKILGIHTETTVIQNNNFNQNNINNGSVSEKFFGNFAIIEDKRKE